MMKKVTSKLIAIAMALAMVLGCMNTLTAFAAETIDGNRKGTITIKKYDSSTTNGEEGEAITGIGIPVDGATFSAYKIINYENNGKYSVDENYDDIIKLDDVVGITKEGSSYGSTDKLEAKIAELQAEIKAKGYTGIEKRTGEDDNPEGEAKFENLDLGVYLIQETSVPTGYTISSQAFLVSIPQWDQDYNDGKGGWNYDITAYPKDEKITIDKKIGQGTNKTESDSYSIGDEIPYTVTAKIPDYGYTLGTETSASPKKVTTELLEQGEELQNKGVTDPYKKYNDLKVVFTDTLTKGLTLNMSEIDNLQIKVLKGDSNGNDVTLENGALDSEEVKNTLKAVTDYSAEDGKADDNEGKNFVVSVTPNTDENGNAITVMTVTVSWSALEDYQGKEIQLTYSARLNEDAEIGDPNTNTVDYAFTNDPQQSFGDGRTHSDPDPETEVYTYQMNLKKLLNDKVPTSSEDVSGVTFKLYEGNSVDQSKCLYVKGNAGDYTICTDKKDTNMQDINPNSTGALTVKGFKAGTYTLEETKSVDGYTLLTKPITIVVSEVTENGKVIGTVNATMDGKSLVTTDAGDGTDAADGIFKITVNNVKKQFNLPQTGGSGLWMFTIAGGILMAAAIIFFYTLRAKRRKGI